MVRAHTAGTLDIPNMSKTRSLNNRARTAGTFEHFNAPQQGNKMEHDGAKLLRPFPTPDTSEHGDVKP